MRWMNAALVALTACLLWITVACEPTSDVDHLAIARQLEAQLQVPGDYSDPAYSKVAEELQLVQTGDDGYEEAQTWLKAIQKGRQDALFHRNEAPEIQEGGFHPPVVPQGSEVGDSSQGSWTAAGWLPFNDVPTRPGSRGSSRYAGGSSAALAPSAAQASAAAPASKCKKGPVVLYGTSWCGVCAEARAYFRRKGVSFTDKDVEKDASAMAEMKSKAPSATSYPVIDVGGEIMPGFSASALDRKLCL